jgi:hypothetical protein
MPIYHYAVTDYQSWFIKIWQIQASWIDAAEEHLMGDDVTVIISENKIPVYKNKVLLVANNEDDA